MPQAPPLLGRLLRYRCPNERTDDVRQKQGEGEAAAVRKIIRQPPQKRVRQPPQQGRIVSQTRHGHWNAHILPHPPEAHAHKWPRRLILESRKGPCTLPKGLCARVVRAIDTSPFSAEHVRAATTTRAVFQRSQSVTIRADSPLYTHITLVQRTTWQHTYSTARVKHTWRRAAGFEAAHCCTLGWRVAGIRIRIPELIRSHDDDRCLDAVRGQIALDNGSHPFCSIVREVDHLGGRMLPPGLLERVGKSLRMAPLCMFNAGSKAK